MRTFGTSARCVSVLLAIALAACGGAPRPADEAASGTSSVNTAEAAPSAATGPSAAAGVPSVSASPSCLPPTPRPSATAFPMRTPIGTFEGAAGASVGLAVVEAVDVPAATITVVFPRTSTGGSVSGTPSARARLRVTPSSLMQELGTVSTPLAGTASADAKVLALAAGAPAVAAKTAIVLASPDVCGGSALQPAEVSQSAPANSPEWALTGPIGRALPAGSSAISTQLRTLRLADLHAEDLLVGPGGAGGLTFGLTFSGAAPNFTLTRLIRRCTDDPCPRYTP